MSVRWTNKVTALACAGAMAMGSAIFAEDKPPAEKEKTRARHVTPHGELRVVAVRHGTEHWIGIHAMPITDEALTSQLGIKDRLIVVQVLPESPAAKAGVQQHDILLKFGDKELHTLEDLVKAVDGNAEKEAKLTVLRGGKEVGVNVQPAKRPKDELEARLTEIQPQDLRVFLHGGGPGQREPGGQYILRMIGPGILGHDRIAGAKPAPLPNGVSITVSKENDQPAKVVAKKDGKTYETTEDRLDVLPDDLRQHVARFFEGPQALAWVSDVWNAALSEKVEEDVKKAVESAKKQSGKDGAGQAAVRNRVEIRRVEGGALESLKKELDDLRKDVEKLKSGKETKDDEAKPNH